MAPSRQLRLGAFMRPVSIHTGAWRYPGAFPDANFNFAHLKRFAQTLERGKFDAFFMADHLAVLNMPIEALKRSHTVTSFEPFTLLSALAVATEHIGLVATASTTFDAPYHDRPPLRLARPHQRRPRRLEHRHHLQPRRGAQFRPRRAHGARRALSPRARVLRRRDRPVGQLGRRRLHPRRRERHLFRPRQAACARPQGRVPLGARSAQHRAADPGLAGHRAGRRVRGRPPARGRDRRGGLRRAAATSPAARAFYADVKGRAEKAGRDPRPPQDPARLPSSWSATPWRRRAPSAPCSTASCTTTAASPRCRSRSATMPPSSTPTGRCRRFPKSNASKSGRERVIELRAAREPDRAPARAAARRLWRPGDGRHARRPSPTRWRSGSTATARDGFNVMFPYLPGGLDDFVDRRGAGTAAARPVPARVRRQDAARESRPAAAREPVFLTAAFARTSRTARRSHIRRRHSTPAPARDTLCDLSPSPHEPKDLAAS